MKKIYEIPNVEMTLFKPSAVICVNSPAVLNINNAPGTESIGGGGIVITE